MSIVLQQRNRGAKASSRKHLVLTSRPTENGIISLGVRETYGTLVPCVSVYTDKRHDSYYIEDRPYQAFLRKFDDFLEKFVDYDPEGPPKAEPYHGTKHIMFDSYGHWDKTITVNFVEILPGQPNPQRNGAQMFITDFVDKRAIFEQWGQDMARLTKMTQAELRRLRYRESTVKKEDLIAAEDDETDDYMLPAAPAPVAAALSVGAQQQIPQVLAVHAPAQAIAAIQAAPQPAPQTAQPVAQAAQPVAQPVQPVPQAAQVPQPAPQLQMPLAVQAPSQPIQLQMPAIGQMQMSPPPQPGIVAQAPAQAPANPQLGAQPQIPLSPEVQVFIDGANPLKREAQHVDEDEIPDIVLPKKMRASTSKDYYPVTEPQPSTSGMDLMEGIANSLQSFLPSLVEQIISPFARQQNLMMEKMMGQLAPSKQSNTEIDEHDVAASLLDLGKSTVEISPGDQLVIEEVMKEDDVVILSIDGAEDEEKTRVNALQQQQMDKYMVKPLAGLHSVTNLYTEAMKKKPTAKSEAPKKKGGRPKKSKKESEASASENPELDITFIKNVKKDKDN